MTNITRKALLASVLAMGFAAPAIAEVKVTLGGSADFQAGHRSQETVFERVEPVTDTSAKLNEYGFASDTHIDIKVDGVADELGGLKYGGMIRLNADTSRSNDDWTVYDGSFTEPAGDNNDEKTAEQTMLYLEGVFGKLEMGAYTGSTHAMQVDASSIAHGAYGDAKRWWNKFTFGYGNFGKDENFEADANATVDQRVGRATALTFLQSANLPTNAVSRYGLHAKNANKITYYTPQWNGFMFGVSYTPDMDAHGTVNRVGRQTKTFEGGDRAAVPFRNVWEGGMHYQGQFNDVGIKASLLGQTGDAKKMNLAGVPTTAAHDLNAWEVGLNLNWQGWKFGGSYGSWGKSGQWKIQPNGAALGAVVDTYAGNNIAGKETEYWTAGLGYENGPFGVSFTYFESHAGLYNQSGQNELRTFTLGADYKLAPGFMPYLDITHFEQKDRSTYTDLNGGGAADDLVYKAKNNDGVIILLGTKLQF